MAPSALYPVSSERNRAAEQIALNHAMPAPPKSVLQDTGLRHFAFEVDDVDAMFAHVKACGCETVSEPSTCEDGSMRLFFVRDPEENLIEIMQFYK